MRIAKGRLLRAEQLPDNVRSVELPTVPRLAPGKLLPRSVVEAIDRAREIVARAEESARSIVDQAERAAADVRLRAEAEGRADGAAKLAALALALAARDARAEERALERSVDLARILAERLLGESLRVAPEQIVSLAREALRETRGARQVAIIAHPDDAKRLDASVASLGLDPSLLRIAADPSRSRGNLRIETEIGVLDAELAPQLERLALKLREALAHERR